MEFGCQEVGGATKGASCLQRYEMQTITVTWLIDSDFAGFICLYLYKLGYKPQHIAPIIAFAFIIFSIQEVIRFQWPAFNKFFFARVYRPLMREHEMNKINGALFYLLGVWIVLSFFPKVGVLFLPAD